LENTPNILPEILATLYGLEFIEQQTSVIVSKYFYNKVCIRMAGVTSKVPLV